MSKDDGGPDLKRIDKVAVRHHLYTPKDVAGRRDNSFEEKLAELEQWFASPVWRLLQEGFADLSWEPLRKMVALLAATMFMRNPKHHAMVHELRAQLVQLCSGPHGLPHSIQIGDRITELDPHDWPSYRDASEDDIKRLWITEMNGAALYAQMFLDMRWSIVFSEQPVFITTDNPVCFLHPSLTFRGIANPETSVLFPLSPTRLLSFDNLRQEPANQYYPLKGSGAGQNLLLWRGAIEHMFCHRHPDLVCADFLADGERHAPA